MRKRASIISVIAALTAASIAAMPVSANSWSPEAEIAGHIKKNYPWAEVEVADVRLSGEAPAERPHAIMPRSGALPGRAVFELLFDDNVKITANAVVKAYDRVVMSRGAFGKGTVLKDEDLYETLMDVTKIPRNSVRAIAGASGRPLLRSVVPNMPIRQDMISSSLQVKSGRRIAIVFESGRVSVRSTGEMKQNGFVGDMVKVVNTASKKIIMGLLVDENTVKVEF